MKSQPIIKDGYQFGFHKPESSVFRTPRGLSRQVVEAISHFKNEPDWMRQFRLQALMMFEQKMMPTWGADLSGIDFDNIFYYISPTQKKVQTWDDVPADIKDTYDQIGIPQAEQKFLAGVGAQYDCITGDALILGSQGMTQLKDIKPGSYVYALNTTTKALEKQRVLGVICKGKRPIFNLKVAGRSIRCTTNHPLLTLKYERPPYKQRGKFSTTWEYLKSLKVGDYIAVTKDVPDSGVSCKLPTISFTKAYEGSNQFGNFSVQADYLYTRSQRNLIIPKLSTESLLWLIGLYLGDGYITKVSKATNKEVLNIAIPKTEKNMRAKVIEVFDEVFCYQLKDQKEKFRLRIFSKPIIEFFTNLGLRGNARTKKIPEWIFKLPKNQKLAFIAGYIDADGAMRNDKRNSDVLITSVNNKMLEGLQILGISCGLRVTGIHTFLYTPDVTMPSKKLTGYRLQITGDLTHLIDYSLKVKYGFIPRKYYHTYGSYHKSSIKKYISNEVGFAPIQEISPAGEEFVYDIEVEGHHNFIANGIVVHNSEVIYHNLKKKWEDKGVIFVDTDTALKKYPDIFRQYFGTVIPISDNKFAALNSAVWSGGSFVYVPKGVHVEIPLQAYFRINAANMGQFERTLIIAEEGSYVHYVEGCSAPIYTTDSLHSAVVEIVVKKAARVRYTTIQNWSDNVYNLVTKRMLVEEEGFGEWIDANYGSRATMKYPSVILNGKGAKGEVLSLAYAGKGQHQDAGGKAIHLAPYTTSTITSKSVSLGGGRSSYRGMVKIVNGAKGSKSFVRCDALLLDELSRSDTYPTNIVNEEDVTLGHEASVSKVGEEQLFYLMSRGLSEAQATSMIVNGFIEPIVKELPLEYAVELNRLISMSMEGSVG